MELNQGVTSISTAVKSDISTAIFDILRYFPFTDIISIAFLILIAIYFVTSCDSGTLVINALISHQYIHPPIWGRIFWGMSIGIIAAILINFGGADALRTLTIIIALPFLIILLLGGIGT